MGLCLKKPIARIMKITLINDKFNLLGIAVVFAVILSACSDSSNNSNVYSCEQLTVEGSSDNHICYESSEEDFTDCKEDSVPFSYKTILTPGRGCPSGALKICDAELVPGHPYTIYVYNEEIAQMNCKRIRGF